MAKKKESTPTKVEKPKDDLKAIREKRESLIAEIQESGLLTNLQLRKGGSYIRGKYQKELGWTPVLGEINELGRKLGIPPIGLGSLRKP